MKIADILEKAEDLNHKIFEIEGWVIGKRTFQNVAFLYVNDGSNIEGIQVVFKEKNFVEKVNLGSSVFLRGVLVYTPGRKQICELEVKEFKLLAQASDRFLIQKNEINLELLREQPEIRHRTKLFRAIMLVRDKLFREIHKFFEDNDFLYFSAPLLTSNDGEGAGETFIVSTKNKDDFFSNKKGNSTFLTVTGQLHAEAYAQGFKRVYCFGPTFRAEKSHTLKHAAEFLMVEPEAAFCDINCIIKLAHELLLYVSSSILKTCKEELKFLEEYSGTKIMERLKVLANSNFKVIEYKEAIKILRENKNLFEGEEVIEFGTDLSNVHERFLTEVYFKSPVTVINFPRKIKAFYMKKNTGEKTSEETVASFDILVEDIGEIIGGSERESNVEELNLRLSQLGISSEGLEWYIKLREFGYFSSSGFGLGFERLLMYFTGIRNIRDVIPFPRTAGTIMA